MSGGETGLLFSSPASAQPQGSTAPLLPLQPLSRQGFQCSHRSASLQDGTKGRFQALPAHLQRWCVIAWPLGTLSHPAWKAPASPILSCTCCFETVSFSWTESLSLLACDGQSCDCDSVTNLLPWGSSQPGRSPRQTRSGQWRGFFGGGTGSLGEGGVRLAGCSPPRQDVAWQGRGV